MPLLRHCRQQRGAVSAAWKRLAASGAPGAASQAASVQATTSRRGLALDAPEYWSLAQLQDVSRGEALAQLPEWLEGLVEQLERLADAAAEAAPRPAAAWVPPPTYTPAL